MIDIQEVIGGWLQSKHQRSGSQKTLATYQVTLLDFRNELLRIGLDLDSSDIGALAFAAQDWAERPRRNDRRPVSPATYNLRLAVISSFYRYARRHGLQTTTGSLVDNPVEFMDRVIPQVTPSTPLDINDVAIRLATIDRRCLAGKRDYALLLVALATQRSLSELAALQWEHVTLTQSGVILTFPRIKGGGAAHYRLPAKVTDALLDWLTAIYGQHTSTFAPDLPLWISLAERNHTFGHQLSIRGIALIYQARLGNSKTEALRATGDLYKQARHV